MNNKKLGRIAAILMAGTLMMSTVTAFGADLSTGASSSTDTYVDFEKEIVLIDIDDPNYDKVSVPKVTFSYLVESDTSASGTKIDADGNAATIKPGPADAIINPNVDIEFDGTETSVDGVVSDKGRVEFDDSKFSAAGIYRYKINEVTSNNGYIQTSSDGIRYLDVYVINGPSKPIISGYSLSKTDANGDEVKTYGYTSEYYEIKEIDDGGTIKRIVDPTAIEDDSVSVFKTYDVKIIKKIEGDLGDKTHKFPFEVRFTSTSDDNDGIEVQVYENGGTTAVTSATLGLTNSTSSVTGLSLSDEEYFIIKGVPEYVKYSVLETNDTTDTYTVKFGNATEGRVNPNGTGISSELVILDDNAIDEMIVTNTLSSISPTGLALKVMPYVLAIVFAVVVAGIVLNKKRRNDEI